MSFFSTFNNISKNGWSTNTNNYSLIAKSTANSFGFIATSPTASTTYRRNTTSGANNQWILTYYSSNNTVSIAGSQGNRFDQGYTAKEGPGNVVFSFGSYDANSITNRGMIEGPFGTVIGNITGEWLGQGLAISLDGNIIAATHVVSNVQSNAIIWAYSSNTWSLRNDFNISTTGGVGSEAALNGYGNSLLVTNYVDGSAYIYDYNSNANTWTETANLFSNIGANYGISPWLNYNADKAIFPILTTLSSNIVIWEKTSNVWSSSVVTLDTAGGNIALAGSRLTIADDGNILGAPLRNGSDYFYGIYAKNNNNLYELIQIIPNPLEPTAVIGTASADTTKNGKFLILGAGNTANSTVTNTVLYFVK